MLPALLVLLLAPVPVYVGPAPAEPGEFVDVDSGVSDSISDVRAEVKARKDHFRLVDSEAEARIRLYVVERSASSGDTSIAVSSTGQTATVIPMERRRLHILMRVDDYKRPIERSGDSWWRDLAKDAVRDVVAWTDANAERLR